MEKLDISIESSRYFNQIVHHHKTDFMIAAKVQLLALPFVVPELDERRRLITARVLPNPWADMSKMMNMDWIILESVDLSLFMYIFDI